MEGDFENSVPDQSDGFTSLSIPDISQRLTGGNTTKRGHSGEERKDSSYLFQRELHGSDVMVVVMRLNQSSEVW